MSCIFLAFHPNASIFFFSSDDMFFPPYIETLSSPHGWYIQKACSLVYITIFFNNKMSSNALEKLASVPFIVEESVLCNIMH